MKKRLCLRPRWIPFVSLGPSLGKAHNVFHTQAMYYLPYIVRRGP